MVVNDWQTVLAVPDASEQLLFVQHWHRPASQMRWCWLPAASCAMSAQLMRGVNSPWMKTHGFSGGGAVHIPAVVKQIPEHIPGQAPPKS